MARYYVSADEDQATVARELLDAADDHRTVIYLPGEGPNGAFDLPDSLADSYQSKKAGKVYAEQEEKNQALRDLDAAYRVAPGPGEPTTEDLLESSQKTNTVTGTYDTPKPAKRTSKRAPAKAPTAAEE